MRLRRESGGVFLWRIETLKTCRTGLDARPDIVLTRGIEAVFPGFYY
jgi:hypothetical protein